MVLVVFPTTVWQERAGATGMVLALAVLAKVAAGIDKGTTRNWRFAACQQAQGVRLTLDELSALKVSPFVVDLPPAPYPDGLRHFTEDPAVVLAQRRVVANAIESVSAKLAGV